MIQDGGRKRAAGSKVHWTVDEGHMAALYRHLEAWEAGPAAPYFDPDPDSGAHPLVHVAARALMVAGQETGAGRG